MSNFDRIRDNGEISMDAQNTLEYIGNMPLILDNYNGHDDYNEDDVFEEFLLRTTKENGDIAYSAVIAQNSSFPILYHLSHLRENIICWYSLSSEDHALEIGAGCGAVTGVLARNCGKVDCVDLSKRRCMVNAYRYRNFNNLRIYVSNFEDFVSNTAEKYSVIKLLSEFWSTHKHIYTLQILLLICSEW